MKLWDQSLGVCLYVYIVFPLFGLDFFAFALTAAFYGVL